MKRREFITLVGGALVAWPEAARAQQRPKTREQQRFKIGLLDTGLGAAFTVPFMRKLVELGYVEGRNVDIERKSADGNSERLKEFAADLVRQQVDVIVTIGRPPALPPNKPPIRSQSFSAPIAIRSASVWLRASRGPAEMRPAIL